MSCVSPPSGPHSDAPRSKRLAALGAALAVTGLTLAGAFGIGPGAALGETPAGTAANSPVAQLPTDEPRASKTSDDWLTVEDAPTYPTSTKGSKGGSDHQVKAAIDLPARSGDGRRIVYDISDQRVWLVSNKDRVASSYLVSGSRDEKLLDPGRYRVYSMSRDAVSFDSRETMNYMVRFASGERSAIGFHDIPARADGTLLQSRSDLGTPQSAGCIRQWISDAKALWEFSSVGTRVVVTA